MESGMNSEVNKHFPEDANDTCFLVQMMRDLLGGITTCVE